MHPFFNSISNESKATFIQNSMTMHLSDHEADFAITLTMKNSAFCYEGKPDDYEKIFLRIAKCSENLVHTTEKIVLQNHIFLLLMTVLVNGMGMMSAGNQKKLQNIIFHAIE
mmetsp:Transcript_26232/g.19705  ORF Transcript_26232/g.19705 Transcript_26232/m.19705 type:complete len:112 (+) Transcript_26232:920-1255(+)